MRELKIINTALVLKELNLENVLEAEKLLYQNIVSSIKGYRKVKAISIFEGQEVSKPEEQIQIEDDRVPEIDDTEPIIEKESEISETIIIQEREKLDFMLLRFIKKTPPLVGIDLINYGPFEQEDLASIPSQNAKILILEKFAEKVDIS
jgi:DNA replication initiation complex subunit (GINS family)